MCITFDIVSLYIHTEKKKTNKYKHSFSCVFVVCFDSFAVVFLYHPDRVFFFFFLGVPEEFLSIVSLHNFFFFCLIFVSTKCTQDPSFLYDKGKKKKWTFIMYI